MNTNPKISKETLQNIFKREDIPLSAFIEIANAAGYEVLPNWDKENHCPVLETRKYTRYGQDSRI